MLYTDEAIKKRKRKTAKIKKSIVTIIYIILIPVLVYNITLIAQSIINPNRTPSFFGIKAYVIISGSMKPELDIGDIVIVKNTDAKELKEGDIISYRKGQSVVTHRISQIVMETKEKKYRTKGDNNNVEDTDSVEFEQIEGKVIRKIPTIGNIVIMLKDKTVILIMVILYYIYLVCSQSRQRRKNLRSMKREQYEKKQRDKQIEY